MQKGALHGGTWMLFVIFLVSLPTVGAPQADCPALQRLTESWPAWQDQGLLDHDSCRWTLSLGSRQKSRFYTDLRKVLARPEIHVHAIDLVWSPNGLSGQAEFRWSSLDRCISLQMEPTVLMEERSCEFRPPSQPYGRLFRDMQVFVEWMQPGHLEAEQYKAGYYSLVLVSDQPLRRVFQKLQKTLAQHNLRPGLLIAKIGRIRTAVGVDARRVQEKMKDLPEQAAILELIRTPLRMELTFAATKEGTHLVIMVGWPRDFQ